MSTDTARGESAKHGQSRSWWATITASAVIVVAVVGFAVLERLPTLQGSKDQWTPFVFALIGVALYVMSSAKSRRERFDVRYVPDYCYRAAQAVVYLYLIMAIIAQAGPTEGYEFTNWPPNLIGLMVGMFILHVEKAVEGLGQRFEEVLAGFLPRSLVAKTSREKQLEQLRSEQKFQSIKAQSELLASQIRDPALRAEVPKRLAEAERAIRDGDLDSIEDAVNSLAWDYEQLKVGLREEEMTLAEVLSLARRGREDTAGGQHT